MHSAPRQPAAGGAPAPTLPRFLLHLDAWLQRHTHAAAWCLYVCALALRALHWFTFRETLVAQVFMMDESYYHDEALNLVRGLPNPTDSYFMTPLYPLFLSLVFRLAGDSASTAYAVQLLMGGLAAPLVFLLARRAMPAAWAAAAGLAMASFAPVVFYEALLLVEWLVLLTLLAASFVAVRAPRSRLHALAAGALLGIAVLGRGSNLALLLVFFPWFAWRRGGASVAQAGRCLLGCAAVLAPLWIYNARHAEQPLLLTANAGFNLYIGNGPEATGLFFVPESFDMAHDPMALRYVQRQTGQRATASVAAQFWVERTQRWVREHPLRALDLLGWKWVLFWNRFYFPQVECFETATRGLPLSRLPFWHSYAVLPLGFLGALWALIEAWRAWRRGAAAGQEAEAVLGFIGACALLYVASIVLFFVTDRYRIPVTPWLIVLATHVCRRICEALWQRKRAQAAALLLATAALFVLTSPARLNLDRARVGRDIHVHSALRYAQAERFGPAIAEYREALRTAPANPDLRDGLARMLSRAGQDSLALALYRDLLREHPDFARGWYNLGNVLRRSRRVAEAAAAYERSVALEPEREAAWNNLGECRRALGDTAAAAQAYRRALAIVPGHEQALNNLAALRGAQGDAPAAEAGFRAAIAANPRYLPAWTNLAILLTNQGRRPEAVPAWRFILALDPADTLAPRALRQLETGAEPH